MWHLLPVLCLAGSYCRRRRRLWFLIKVHSWEGVTMFPQGLAALLCEWRGSGGLYERYVEGILYLSEGAEPKRGRSNVMSTSYIYRHRMSGKSYLLGSHDLWMCTLHLLTLTHIRTVMLTRVITQNTLSTVCERHHPYSSSRSHRTCDQPSLILTFWR